MGHFAISENEKLLSFIIMMNLDRFLHDKKKIDLTFLECDENS